MLDRFQGLQVFLKVAELGSLSAAARALEMSPTMATKHIAAQEARLGVRLFHRSTRRVTLTDVGKTYRESAERVVGDLERAENVASAAQTTVSGMLRVNVPVSFGISEIGPLIKDFADLYPLLSVELGLNDRLVDLAEEGWDMAVRIGSLASSPLIARKLAPCRMALCASPEYLAQHGLPTKVAELAAHECLGYTLSNVVGPHTWTFGTKTKTNVSVSGRLRSSNGDVLLAAAIAGQGLTYQPTFIVAEAVRTGKLIPIELDQPPFIIGDVFAIYLPTTKVAAKISAFTNFLASRFGGVPPWDKRFSNVPETD